MYEEESDSEPEIEESQFIPEEEFIEEEKEEEKTKQSPPERKNRIFEYLNEDAKRNKQ